MRKILELKKGLCICLSLCLGIGMTAAGTPETALGAQKKAKYLSEIEVNAETKDSYSDEGKYNKNFYDKINRDYNSSYSTPEQSLTISDKGQLAAFAKAVNEGKDFDGKYVKLAGTIDLEGEKPSIKENLTGDKYTLTIGNQKGEKEQELSNIWIPIGKSYEYPFKGTFDGNHKKIKGMVVLDKNARYSGFFGHLAGNIKNLTIEEGYTISKDAGYNSYVGGLVGDINPNSTVSNGHSTGIVAISLNKGFISAGGLVGHNEAGIIENSSSESKVFGYNNSGSYINFWGGGLLGYNNRGKINGCNATGDVAVCSKNVSMAGGLAGYNNGDNSHGDNSKGKIENSYASGKVSSFTSEGTSAYGGGLVGFNGGWIKSCYAEGDTAAAVDSAASKASAYAGGLTAMNSHSATGDSSGWITESYASGNVSSLTLVKNAAAYGYGGGLVAYNYNGGIIKNSYALGDVDASSYGGGLVGCNMISDASIESSYALGDVTASYGGGLVAHNQDAKLKNNYRNSETKISADKRVLNEGTVLTSEQMTGIGTGRADHTMSGFDQGIWTFTKDGPITLGTGRMYFQNLYYPRLKSIVYPTGQEPKYIKKKGYQLNDCIEVRVTGTILEGSVLTAKVTDKKGAPAAVKSTQKYQWYVDNKAINKAVNSTYRIGKGEAGKQIKVVVTAPSFLGQVEAFAIRASGVRMNKKELILYKGKTGKLSAVIAPSNVSGKSVQWTSSNPKAVTVDSTGKVTAKGYGRAVIKAEAKDGSGKYASCKVTVPYRIRYVLNKGKNHKSNPAYYYDQKITLKKPSRKGYYFKGWYQDKKLKKKISKISKGTKKNYKIYAKWSKVKVGSTWMYNLRNKKTRTVTFQWRKVKSADGYQIKYSVNKNFAKAKSTYRKGKKATLKNLKSRKIYYIKVRAYKIDSAGKKVFGKYSKAMKWRVW